MLEKTGGHHPLFPSSKIEEGKHKDKVRLRKKRDKSKIFKLSHYQKKGEAFLFNFLSFTSKFGLNL
ncbi:MAG: hypothetical protein IEMM0002_0783 [bacterium]|nr:MAG: hypothetical protein IEMM0002_0783 [bacterium]